MSFSIVIATKDREKVLLESLEKAIEFKKGFDFEIIVINDGDKNIEFPVEIVQQIIYVPNQGKGVSKARNLGASIAKNDFLFFIDDDMWLTPDFFNWFLQKETHIDISQQVYHLNWEYPPVLIEKMKSNLVGKYLLQSNFHTMWGRLGMKGAIKSGEIEANGMGSGSFLISKVLFHQMGGYNENIIFQGEDLDFSTRLLQKGVKIFLVFDVCLFHNQEDRLLIDSFLKREFDGYVSQFNAIKTLKMPFKGLEIESKIHLLFLQILLFLEKLIVFCLKNFQNINYFKSFSIKLLGILCVLQKYKAWQISR